VNIDLPVDIDSPDETDPPCRPGSPCQTTLRWRTPATVRVRSRLTVLLSAALPALAPAAPTLAGAAPSDELTKLVLSEVFHAPQP
jgi:hypothetical protein